MKLLFIGAHTDDIELGCGGTIARMVESGHEVCCACCSYCGKEILHAEFYESMKYLDVDSGIIALHEFPVHHFDKYRQEILAWLIGKRDFFQPDQVYTHSRFDRHQDHKVVGEESLRAFRANNVFTYTSAHNRLWGVDDMYMKLDDIHMDTKVGALAKYESQKDRVYMQPQYILSTAYLTGAVVGLEFAEGFEVVKQII